MDKKQPDASEPDKPLFEFSDGVPLIIDEPKQPHIGKKQVLIIIGIVIVIGGLGFGGWFLGGRHDNGRAAQASQPITKVSKDTERTSQATNASHTAREAATLVQTTYDAYLAAVTKANGSSMHTQPVAQAGLAAIKDKLTSELYSKAAAVNQATPFSCTAQYVASKYTASLKTSDASTATVAIAISKGGGLTTSGMTAIVDLSSLKITAVTCPS